MYCQKCNRLLDEDNKICPKCGFDNKNSLKKNTLKESTIIKSKKPSKFRLLILFLCLLVVGLSVTLIIYENTHKEEDTSNIYDTSNLNDYTNKFTYKSISLKYPDTWGSSTGTIFYKEYAKINITFNTITNEQYNEALDVNECLDYSFTNIKAKTYASDTSYSYIFEIDNIYYLITVNYLDNNAIFTNEIKTEISNILTTLSA